MVDGEVQAVLRRFPAAIRPLEIVSLGASGGFSGAQFWKLLTPRGWLCLRRWPSQLARHQLEFVHGVLDHIAGCDAVSRLTPDVPAQRLARILPTPIRTLDQASFAYESGHFWELTRWLPGEADFHRAPSRTKLADAMATLAEFHLAAARDPNRPSCRGRSQGLAERLVLLQRLRLHEAVQIRAALGRSQWPELDSRAVRLLALFDVVAPTIQRQLAAAAEIQVPIQPCIRDIWHDHLLFVEESVSGIVDFGSMRMECISGDLARLAGSLLGDDASAWEFAVDRYRQVRDLSRSEHQLIDTFDRSAVLLAGMNWLRWIYLQRRHFEDSPRILRRLDEILQRLTTLAESLA